MDDTLEHINENVMKGLGELTDFFGFGRVMGQLYGALLLSVNPMSLDELEEIVGKSKASVSMQMRNLERWRMVREVWVKGDRRKFYEAESDLWKIITYVLQSRELNDVRTAVEVLEDDIKQLDSIKDTLDPEKQALVGHYHERVAELHSFFTFAKQLLETFVASEQPPDVDGGPVRIEIEK